LASFRLDLRTCRCPTQRHGGQSALKFVACRSVSRSRGSARFLAEILPSPRMGRNAGGNASQSSFLPSQQCASSSSLPTSQLRWRLESMDTRCYSRSRLYLGEFDFFFDSQNSCTLERTFDTVRESSQELPMKLYRRCGDRLRLRFARGTASGQVGLACDGNCLRAKFCVFCITAPLEGEAAVITCLGWAVEAYFR